MDIRRFILRKVSLLGFVIKRIAFLFLISLGIEAAALLLFNMMPAGIEDVIKTLIVGSYPAMAGAIALTIMP